MDQNTVVIVDATERAYNKEVLAWLARAGLKVRTSAADTEAEIIEAVQEADGIIYSGSISRRFLESLTRCKVIARSTIGMDNIEGIDIATDKGIVLCNMPGVIEEEVADQTMALLLAATRWIVPLDAHVRSSRWARGEPLPNLPIPRFPGSVLGLIGLGRIARAVARRAVGFGVRLVAYDPLLPEAGFAAAGVQRATLAQVLQDSDFVSLHVPLTPETHHMIGEAELRMMKPAVVLINTARGKIIDEPALVRALQERWIAGAGLDVMEQEPLPADHPLLALDNVVLAPHRGGVGSGADPLRYLRPAQEVAAVLAGHRPRAVWNPEVLERRPESRMAEGSMSTLA
jgi:D-3-phosphoglycerate dehydrogenase